MEPGTPQADELLTELADALRDAGCASLSDAQRHRKAAYIARLRGWLIQALDA